MIRLVGLEPTTPRLSSACSNQLSYSRVDVEGKDRDSCRRPRLRGVDLRASALLLHRKEVIQPQVPLRLPCYDFTPVICHTVVSVLLAVRLPTSGATNSHGVTGGVYKARERIHRGMLIRDY